MNATLTARRRRTINRDRDDPTTLDALDDDQLVRHANASAAFAILYERHSPRVIGYCRSRIAHDADAEEVAAQALAKAWAGFPPDHRSTFRSWLFTIAHHTIVDYYRSAARSPGLVDETHLHAIESATPLPDDASIANETRAELVAAIAALPADQQHAIALRVAGLKGREVAEVMGRSHQAVKMLQFRAIATLRNTLAPMSTGEESS